MLLILNIIFQFFVFVQFSSPAFAYIDPGSGAGFFAIISSTIIACLAYIKIQWNNIKNFTKKTFKKIIK